MISFELSTYEIAYLRGIKRAIGATVRRLLGISPDREILSGTNFLEQEPALVKEAHRRAR